MNIAIIGAGNIGSGLARTFAASRHGVVVADLDTAKAHDLATKLTQAGTIVQAAGLTEALTQAELVFLAVPYAAALDIARGQGLSGKIVVDVTNPLKEDFSGLVLGFDTSAAEEIAKVAKGARVLKGFNTVFAQIYESGLDFKGRKVPVYVAGDDAAAKGAVIALAKEIGFDAVDAGPLTNARYIEPMAYLNIQFGYMLGHGTQIAPAWLSR